MAGADICCCSSRHKVAAFPCAVSAEGPLHGGSRPHRRQLGPEVEIGDHRIDRIAGAFTASERTTRKVSGCESEGKNGADADREHDAMKAMASA